MTDPISDMLTRVRNALAVHKTEVLVPFSKMKFGIAEILKKEGYISGVEQVEAKAAGLPHNQLRITLKYTGPKEPAIRSLRRISRPGLRVYAGKEQLPYVLNNMGIAVISTPQGLMTNKQARNAGLGGEVICEVY